jgi:hypothetical protein
MNTSPDFLRNLLSNPLFVFFLAAAVFLSGWIFSGRLSGWLAGLL